MSGLNGRTDQLNRFEVRGPRFEVRYTNHELRAASHGQASLLLLSILYMASLGLVYPSTAHAAGASAGTVISMGGDGGVANVADVAGDVVMSATTVLGNDTTFYSTQTDTFRAPQFDTATVKAVYGDTLVNKGGILAALPGDTAWIDLHVVNKANALDTIFLDSTAPTFKSGGGPASGSAILTFWNSAKTARITNVVLPAESDVRVWLAMFFVPAAPQGDTVLTTVTARARNGLGGDPNGYTGNNGILYAGNGDDTAFSNGTIGSPSSSNASQVAFITGETHVLGSGGSVTISVVVRDTTGITVPNAPVRFGVTYGSDATPASLDANTNSAGVATFTLTLGTASSFYRINAQVNQPTGPSRNFYAYNDRLNIPGQDTSAANVGKGWRMWSPNKTPSTPGTPASVIQADLGGNVTVYEWDANATDVAPYRQYKTPGSIVRGRAYWIKDAEGGILDVPGLADTTVPVYDTLVGRGFHQIGSGQFYYVDWNSGVEFAVANTGPDTFYPPSSSAFFKLIKNAIYWWDESISNYHWGPDTMSLTQVQMKPMAGFWLYVDTTAPVVMRVLPKPADPQDTTVILNQAPKYLSAVYGERQQGVSGNEANWAIQLVAQSGSVVDPQNYIGVMPSVSAAARSSLFEPPGVASGYVTLGILDPDDLSSPLAAASYAPPVTTAKLWKVEVYTDLNSPVTLSWDNLSSIPEKYAVYLATPSGTVDMRKVSTYQLAASGVGGQHTTMTLAVGLPEYVAGFLAAPLSKDVSFVYPNPGPDNNGLMYFKHNVTTGEVKLKIFDVGGQLVRELTGTTSPIQWDTTNRFGQKVGSGVYIYMMESSGNRLVDKLAVVR